MLELGLYGVLFLTTTVNVSFVTVESLEDLDAWIYLYCICCAVLAIPVYEVGARTAAVRAGTQLLPRCNSISRPEMPLVGGGQPCSQNHLELPRRQVGAPSRARGVGAYNVRQSRGPRCQFGHRCGWIDLHAVGCSSQPESTGVINMAGMSV